MERGNGGRGTSFSDSRPIENASRCLPRKLSDSTNETPRLLYGSETSANRDPTVFRQRAATVCRCFRKLIVLAPLPRVSFTSHGKQRSRASLFVAFTGISIRSIAGNVLGEAGSLISIVDVIRKIDVIRRRLTASRFCPPSPFSPYVFRC